MTISELFKTVYRNALAAHYNSHENFVSETWLPEIENEILDLELDGELSELLTASRELVVPYVLECMSVGVTNTLATVCNLKIENDVDLSDDKTVTRLADEADKEVVG